MSLKLFITGTDTNIGKTYISKQLLQAFNQAGKSTIGIKPVASGCELMDGKWQNADALTLQQEASISLAYEDCNPFAFTPPIAPYLAAQQVSISMHLAELNHKMRYALQHPADVCVIEGIGGWLQPLNETETMADFVVANQLAVILVVGMRLGCINHALLTAESIIHKNSSVLGWIANCIDPAMLCLDENIKLLRQRLPMPHLATVHWGKNLDATQLMRTLSMA